MSNSVGRLLLAEEGSVRRIAVKRVATLVAISVCVGTHAVWAGNSPTVAPSGTTPEATQKESSASLAIRDNMAVSMEYTLMSDGAVVDSSEGKGPVHFVQGRRQIIPGLERQLVGLRVGDTKEITVSPEEGYGKVDPAAVIEVAKNQLPSDTTPVVGMFLRGMNPDGQSFRARITEIKKDTVMLDLNHPLAGKTLTFKVKITEIAPAPAPSPATKP